MIAARLFTLYFLSGFLILLGLLQDLKAQNDYRVPFRHRVGPSNAPQNIFQIRGDFTIIGNTNLTLKNYSDDVANSTAEMIFVDIDQVPGTFNSSSANLLFSDENGADPNCTDILYAGLYWSGRVQVPGMTFELTKKDGFLDPVTLDGKKDILRPEESIEYFPYKVFVGVVYDNESKVMPQYEIVSTENDSHYTFRFYNDNTVEQHIDGKGWIPLDNIQIKESNGTATATFDPIEINADGMDFRVYGLTRSLASSYNDFVSGNNSILVESTGTYRPAAYHTHEFDKRKLKFKPPGASNYLEITSAGNAILFPDQELKDIYVGYADVTDLVKAHGAGDYMVADLALNEGFSDDTGMLGNWGLIVVYQNSKMNLRDVAIFDGYTFIQALNGMAQNGELEINGFGAVEEGPVSVKLGIMASEGDNFIGGDYLEILNQKGVWTRLSHPSNSEENFFNSSIYTPIRMKDGNMVENQRFPNLKNNTGIDLVQWELPNVDNSLIANNQSSAKFRFGTNQDLFSLYLLAFSVSSYSPDIEAHNRLESINGAPADESSSIKPGEEATFQVDIRNKGLEGAEQVKLVIPIPYNALFVSAEIIPSTFGTVRFDPDLGVAGSIVWELGDIPIPDSFDEIIASLRYTLNFTEDCFFLANDNCESLLSVSGSLSGIGGISKQHFSGIPFIKGYKDDACEGNAIYGPIEIPITGKAEFVAANCPDFELFTDIDLDNIPVFCHRDSPTNLSDIIRASQEGLEVYFFTEEIGGTPMTDYYVNTSLVGSEKIWVSEGPQGGCTGMRISLELKVIPSSPQPTTDHFFSCLEQRSVRYDLEPKPGYTILYYKDNNPSTLPMTGAPTIDLSFPQRYSIWVSQVKAGECESPRKEVSVYIEDCSLQPEIDLSITSNVERFSLEGENVIFTITVKNPGKVPLINVFVYETLYYNNWTISELGAEEERTFEVAHTITADDVAYGWVGISSQASGNDTRGTIVFDNDAMEITTAPLDLGLWDYAIEIIEASCASEELGNGQIILSWDDEQTGSYILTDQQSGEIEEAFFAPATRYTIDAPAGSYLLELINAEGKTYQTTSLTIEGKVQVEFDVPDTIAACGEYRWIPELEQNVLLTLKAPDGRLVTRSSDGSFVLTQTGTYSVTGSSTDPKFCPEVKTFEAAILQAQEIGIDVRPFCSDDGLTTIDLTEPTQGLTVQWYKIDSGGEEELTDFANNIQLIVSEEGTYSVTLRDASGCMVGRSNFEVKQSSTDPPLLDSLYSFCQEKNNQVEISTGARFIDFSWILNGTLVSKDPIFIPQEAGRYQLEGKDLLGCSFSTEFEVEEKCEPEIRFPNAIWPGDPDKLFEIYPDNLVDEIEVKIFNRWGQLIYHCEDKTPQNKVKSTCSWDGTYNGVPVSNGTYAVIIHVKNYQHNMSRSFRTSVMALD